MIRRAAGLMMALVLWLGAAGGCAEGVTLRTASCFAGPDASALAYTHLLAQWEEKTGNRVEDVSAESGEAWKTGVLMDFAAGNEPDVLFFFTCTADSAYLTDRVVPVWRINEQYPALNIPEDPACAEADGVVYAVPVRSYWEGIFCNTDLFDRCHLELPTDLEKLEEAVRGFRRAGITPLSVSLSDVPHYLVEFAILASGTAEEYKARPADIAQVPDSWVEGMALIRRLYLMGAFPDDVSATSESRTSQMFRRKEAAMQVDGSWFANSLSREAMDTTVVLPFPTQGEKTVVGGVSMGFYLTKRAWNDPERRDAAADLLAFLSTGENARALGGFQFSGRLKESVTALTALPACGPIQDQMTQEARSEWFRLAAETAAGKLTPEAMWEKVMALSPFSVRGK